MGLIGSDSTVFAVVYPGILFGGWGGGRFQQIQLRTDDREKGDLETVAH